MVTLEIDTSFRLEPSSEAYYRFVLGPMYVIGHVKRVDRTINNEKVSHWEAYVSGILVEVAKTFDEIVEKMRVKFKKRE